MEYNLEYSILVLKYFIPMRTSRLIELGAGLLLDINGIDY